MATEKKPREKERKTAKKANSITEYFKEYCEYSTINGFSYIGKSGTFTELIVWIFILILALIGSIFMVYQIVDKWMTTPVLVSLATHEMQISEIPFPAVTICPEAKVSTTCLNYTETLRNIRKGGVNTTAKQNAYFDYMSLICRIENHYESINKKSEGNSDVFGDDEVYSNFLWNCAAVNLDQADCSWMGHSISCKKIMTPIITDEGLCYSFNMFDLRKIYRKRNTMKYFREYKRKITWDPDEGYEEGVEDVYPRNTFLNGAENSFVAIFYTRDDEINYACRNFALQGVRVSLHSPSILPRPSQIFFSVGLDRLTNAAIKPSFTQTSSTIRSYDPEKRFCYFHHERRLKYFRIYAQSHCNLECLTNYTIEQCGCVDFYMPRDNNSRVCNLHERICLEHSKLSFTQNVLVEKLNTENNAGKCNCLPLCSELSYNSEIDAGNWFVSNPDDLNFKKELVGYHASAVRIYMKNPYFLPLTRDELYGFSDAVSDIGGVLGLFSGFSLVSLAEIIYFLSVKMIGNYRRFGSLTGPREVNNY